MTRAQPLSRPSHIAIIMDGNGRWAKSKGLPRSAGHKRGIDALKRAVELTAKFGVKMVSVFVFSSENWKRPESEVSFLMKLFETQIDRQVKDLHKNKVRVRFLGRLTELSSVLQDKISRAEDLTRDNQGVALNVMINYGSRQEMVDAVKSMATAVVSGTLDLNQIDPEIVSRHLYTAGMPDPELLIRTSGEFRLSNYMLWQISYAEVYVTEKFWPDFDEAEYQKALEWYASRERRFGGL